MPICQKTFVETLSVKVLLSLSSLVLLSGWQEKRAVAHIKLETEGDRHAYGQGAEHPCHTSSKYASTKVVRKAKSRLGTSSQLAVYTNKSIINVFNLIVTICLCLQCLHQAQPRRRIDDVKFATEFAGPIRTSKRSGPLHT